MRPANRNDLNFIAGRFVKTVLFMKSGESDLFISGLSANVPEKVDNSILKWHRTILTTNVLWL